MLKVEVNGHEFEMELDSGAARSVIPESVWIDMGKPRVTPCRGQLKAYGGNKLPIKGNCRVEVTFEGRHSEVEIAVMEGRGQALFGRDLIRALNLDMGPHYVKQVKAEEKILPSTEKQLKEEFAELFGDDQGTYKGPEVELRFKKAPVPIFFKARPVPFALKSQVDKKLDELEAKGELKKVMNAEFASPLVIVPKPDGEIRLCVDFKRTINPQLDIPEHPLPTTEVIFQALNGGKKFSKVDLKSAFNQLKLAKDSQKVCTVSTQKGLYQYTRLPFGISSAPAIFQATMDRILQGIPNTAVYLDDITVTGETDGKHLENLREVLKRLRDAGLRLKADKCEFFKKEITLLGHIINAEGIKALPQKIEAIQNMPAPRNLKELTSVLGMIQYYAKFVKGLSTIAAPLNQLRKKGEKWDWGPQQQYAFSQLKKKLTSSEVLVHYDPKIPVRLSTDACDYGIGAQLEHVYPDGSVKVIGYASRSLIPAERNYAQIEKEGLGIVYGVNKFNQYLFGRRFTLLTDHAPLVRIFGPKMGLPTVAARRLQRWATQLMAYSFDIEYVPTDKFGNADGLSRLPNPKEKPTKAARVEDLSVAAIAETITYPIAFKELEEETENDKILAQVVKWVKKGWPKKCPQDQLVPYFRKRHSLTIQKGCLLKGN
ncbi:unnamed protein product [Bursaphelenchus xylophilus]|uniref:(pine wood nematode) hypothetical protein n=1 Tax=Bursaphelenchus xylophilus TaxID=6326 RepID=A0A1I7S5C3_BURXY|nr:unnamed protein product [Bursaphelenchus xylophilus]CAG9117919.1 unnamed protein product [Bursaphelenchus xylophilus]